MRPNDPFDDAPPHLATPDEGLRVWLTQPAGLFSRTSVSHFSQSFADFLAQDAMRLLRVTCPGKSPYVFAHDWSSLRTYESGARLVLTRWGFDLRNDMKLVRIYVGTTAPKLVRMGATVACASLAVAGYDVRVVDDLAAEMRRIGIRPRPA